MRHWLTSTTIAISFLFAPVRLVAQQKSQAQPQASAMSPVAWVLWGHEESTLRYKNGKTDERDRWWLTDAFETFTMCKQSAQRSIQEPGLVKDARIVSDNAGFKAYYNFKFTEEDNKKQAETTARLLEEATPSDREFMEGLEKRRGPLMTHRRTIQSICLPAGTDPRPKVKE